MARKRVSKGAVIVKKEEKVAAVIRDLGVDADFETFFEVFKATYPKEWSRVCRRYEEHERLNKPEKGHPMARPPKYMENVFRAFQKKLRDRKQSPEEFLHILSMPKSEKPKFQDGEPPRELNKMLKGAKHFDIERREVAVNRLGKYRCETTISALREVMLEDSSPDIRKRAHEKLVLFEVEGLPDPE
jgi:hypothetical protein